LCRFTGAGCIPYREVHPDSPPYNSLLSGHFKENQIKHFKNPLPKVDNGAKEEDLRL